MACQFWKKKCATLGFFDDLPTTILNGMDNNGIAIKKNSKFSCFSFRRPLKTPFNAIIYFYIQKKLTENANESWHAILDA